MFILGVPIVSRRAVVTTRKTQGEEDATPTAQTLKTLHLSILFRSAQLRSTGPWPDAAVTSPWLLNMDPPRQAPPAACVPD